MSGIRVGGSWRTAAVTSVKVGGSWRTVATISVKVAGAWKATTFAGAPAAPVVAYLGSGASNLGLFEVSNTVPGAEYIATNISGGGSATASVVNGKVRFQLSSATSRWSVKARYAAGAPESAVDYMERKSPDQTSVPYTQCYNPCGDCNTSVNPNTWSCGCGSGCNDSGGGAWGVCICRGPGYSYWNNYSGSGYGWSGSDYTNGAGEWWKTS